MSEAFEDLGYKPPATIKPLKPAEPKGRAAQLNGCQHTEDMNGWLMDSDGRITGKCPCWNEVD